MGCQSKPAVGESKVELTEEELKAARKAERKAAKLTATADVDAVDAAPTEAAIVETDEEKAARKAARKAAKLAAGAVADAGEVAPTEMDVDEEAAAKAKAERKALKAAAKAVAEAADTPAPASEKRKAAAMEDSESTEASTADQKQRKNEDGSAVATKVLGPDAYCKAHQIVADSGCPEPLETFDQAAPVFGPRLTQALLAQGYTAPTPIQAQGWPLAMQGRDVVAVAKTGSGKTCGFLLPALARIAERGPAPSRSGFCRDPATPSCLVLAPTRELVQQIASEAQKFAKAAGVRVVVLFGGVPKGDQVREAKGGADIVIATPGRLLDLAAGAPDRGLGPAISMEKVNYLVLDEADRMLDMGFEPDIRKIAEQCKPSGRPDEGGGATGPKAGSKRQTLFFTATWPKAVQRTARSLTSNDAVNVSIGQGADGDKLSANPMVKQTIMMVQDWEKSSKLHEILKTELAAGESCVVFASQKHICDTVEQEINRNAARDYGFTPWCRAIHSGREQWQRDEALAQFRALTAAKGEQRGILVATDVAARGLDIPGVAMVVVHDFGKSKWNDNTSVESYVHRIGRTGRAGRSGKAFAFFTGADSGAPELVEVLQGAGQAVPEALIEISNAEWYKNQEMAYRKNRYKGGKGKSGGKGGKGKGGGKGGKAFAGRGGGKG